MNRYFLYGLTIESTMPLSGVASSTGSPDILVRTGSVAPVAPNALGERVATATGQASTRFALDGVAAIEVRKGREIIVDRAQGAADAAIRDLVLGPALAYALFQRGRLILHATAVAIAGRAVAFVARSGGGKSTTGASFHDAGYPLVADDLVAVALDAGAPLVHRGPPRVKLLPDAIAHLRLDPADLAAVDHRFPKRVRTFDGGTADPLPLARIYVLQFGPRTVVEPLAGHQAVAAVLPNAGPLPHLPDAELRAYLPLCAALVSRVPVSRLVRPRVLDSLPAVIDAVREDLSA